jgi:NH3-dependent NAD+ synthetase
VLGVRDYVTKCGFSSVCLGLSGGIDSALTAGHRRRRAWPGKRPRPDHAECLFLARQRG